MTPSKLTLVLITIQITVIYSWNLELISNFFNLQHVQVITACFCSAKDVKNVINLGGEKFRVKFYTPESNDAPTFNSRAYAQGVFIDLTCSYSKRILETDHGAMNTSYKWFAWIGSEDMSCLDRSLLGVDSDMVVATESGELYDVYKIGRVHPVRAARIGNWSRSGGISLRPRPPRDLAGATLRGSVYVYDLKVNATNYEAVILNKSHEPDLDIFHRYHFNIVTDLRYLYKFNTVPVFANATGHLLPDGRFEGMIGDISEDRADIAMSPAINMAPRAKVVRYLPPLNSIRLIFIYLNSRTLGTYKALLLPLSTEVWVSILGMMVATILCYHFIQKYSPSKEGDKDISAGLVYAVGVVAQQGLVHDSMNLPSRVMAILLLFLTMIITTTYNASIMYGLLSPASVRIRTLEQLEDSSFSLGIIDLPYMTLKENIDINFSEKAKKKIFNTKNPILSLRTGLERVKTSDFAFGGEDTVIKVEIRKLYSDSEKCNLIEIDLRSFPLCLTIQKGSLFRELVTRGLLRLQETGINKRLIQYWYPAPIQCLSETKFIYVALETVSIALLIFGVGFMISLSMFIYEMISVDEKEWS